MPQAGGGGLWRALAISYREFAEHSGVHGLKYITAPGRRPVERLLWAVVTLAGLAGAAAMVATFWSRFADSPTRASVETNHYPAWRLPFPAATLCNANRISRSRALALLRLTQLPEGATEEEALRSLELLQELAQPLPPPAGRGPGADDGRFRLLTALLGELGLSAEQALRRLGQPCEEMLERCQWKGEVVNCSTLFEERKSFIGYCCSFNYRGAREVLQLDGSVRLEAVQRPALRTRFYSHRMGLTVLLNPRADDYQLSTLFSAGVRMLVHGSDEYPSDTALEKLLPAGRELLVRADAASARCTAEVRALAPAARGCVFPHERSLAPAAPLYSAADCLAQCRRRRLLRRCGCALAFYPHAGDAPLCGPRHIRCLQEQIYSMRVRRPEDAGTAAAGRGALYCDCPPPCDSVTYDVQFSSGDFRASQFQRSSFFDGVNVTGRTLFHLYFGNHVTVRTRRDVISSWNDLLSSLGGVFSLFLGCSFMSVIELLYFFTLRLALRYRRLAAPPPPPPPMLAAPFGPPQRRF